jgi:predicted HicB family RNase H-like nuclease
MRLTSSHYSIGSSPLWRPCFTRIDHLPSKEKAVSTETSTSLMEKHTEIYQIAEALFEKGPDWVTFYREIFGMHGIVRHTFPTMEMLNDFEQSDAYREIQHMLTQLRETGPHDIDLKEEPTKVITVRIPKSLHEALRAEAHDHRTSMNKLCISKLLQYIDNQLVPED